MQLALIVVETPRFDRGRGISQRFKLDESDRSTCSATARTSEITATMLVATANFSFVAIENRTRCWFSDVALCSTMLAK